MRFSISECSLEKALLGNTPVLVSDLRIDPATVPDGLELYELRHEDEDWGEICEMSRNILVNCYGSLLCYRAISLNPDGFLPIHKDRWLTLSRSGEYVDDVQEYLAEHPPERCDVFTLRPMKLEDRGLLFKNLDRKPIGEMYGTIGTEEQVHMVASRRPKGTDQEDWNTIKTEYYHLENWLDTKGCGPLGGVSGFHMFADPTSMGRFKDARLFTKGHYGYEVRRKGYLHALLLNASDLSWHIWTYRD